MNNDLYNEYIVRSGRKYRYDPDYDCYYPVREPEEYTHLSQFGWVYVTLLLSAVAYYIEYVY